MLWDLSVSFFRLLLVVFFFFKQKTAYEMRISDWSSDVCSSDLAGLARPAFGLVGDEHDRRGRSAQPAGDLLVERHQPRARVDQEQRDIGLAHRRLGLHAHPPWQRRGVVILITRGIDDAEIEPDQMRVRSEEHTSELQSLMRISYAVFCLKKKNKKQSEQKSAH